MGQSNSFLNTLLHFLRLVGFVLGAVNASQFTNTTWIETSCWATWAVACIVQVLLGVSGKTALEAVLPELGEPWIAGVRAEFELQEVIVEGGDLFRVQLHGDASHGLVLITLHHLHPVRPAVTAHTHTHTEHSVFSSDTWFWGTGQWWPWWPLIHF